MKCPNCGERMRVTNTYAAGEGGSTQRLACQSCHTVATRVSMLVNVDPGYGEGASQLAKQIREGKTPAIGER